MRAMCASLLQIFHKVRNNLGEVEFKRTIREELSDEELTVLRSLFARWVRVVGESEG